MGYLLCDRCVDFQYCIERVVIPGQIAHLHKIACVGGATHGCSAQEHEAAQAVRLDRAPLEVVFVAAREEVREQHQRMEGWQVVTGNIEGDIGSGEIMRDEVDVMCRREWRGLGGTQGKGTGGEKDESQGKDDESETLGEGVKHNKLL